MICRGSTGSSNGKPQIPAMMYLLTKSRFVHQFWVLEIKDELKFSVC
jgi:hypothetical protein